MEAAFDHLDRCLDQLLAQGGDIDLRVEGYVLFSISHTLHRVDMVTFIPLKAMFGGNALIRQVTQTFRDMCKY